MLSTEAKLTDLVARMKEFAGENLESIILYGSAARGDFKEGHSDLNVLCVLRSVATRELTRVAPVVHSGTLLGLNAFTLTAVYLGVHGVARHLWLERGLPLMIVVFCAALARDVAAIALLATLAARAPVWQHVLRYGLAGALAASLVAPAVFAVVTWERRQLGLP